MEFLKSDKSRKVANAGNLLVKVKNRSNHTSSLKARSKRSDINHFVKATRQGLYTYWFTLEEVAYIARLEYNYFNDLNRKSITSFQTYNSLEPLINEITTFQRQAKQTGNARETLIVNLGYAHWIVIVLFYQKKHQKNFKLYYIDSLNYPLPPEVQTFLQTEGILLNDLSHTLYPHINNSNVGLWILEIAENIHKMLDNEISLEDMKIIFSYLPQQYDSHYFKEKRKNLAQKISESTEKVADAWPEHSKAFLSGIDHQSKVKKPKIELENEIVRRRLSLFVETYITYFSKMLGVYHVIAKGDALNLENLKMELKIGATAGLLGIAIAEGVAGSIPSLVGTIRSISAHYYLSPKDKARKITKAFENILPGELSYLLAIVAVEIFHSFESQFMSITDKAGYHVAMERLAENAVVRTLNYIVTSAPEYPLIPRIVTRRLLSAGVIFGSSEKLFDPSIKKLRIFSAGASILDIHGEPVNIDSLYKQVGIRIFNKETQKTHFYTLKKNRNSAYGYRTPLFWEKQDNGDLKEIFKSDYQEQMLPLPESKNRLEYVLWNYKYFLKEETIEHDAKAILSQLKKSDSTNQKTIISHHGPVLFNLRRSISNFSGRKEILNKLHQLLIASHSNMAVISQALSDLTLDSLPHPTQSDQTALSGLGGIGKTQLALRYAELYARHYDNNVIWINADTKGDIKNAFKNLAKKLTISDKNSFGNSRDFDELLFDVYCYFSNKKSLFIFDNVKNYQEFEEFLPKNIIGNIPVILITSRFHYWKNRAQVLLLDVFNEKEAIDFIKTELTIDVHQHAIKIKELITLLQNFPLALQQAVTYINLQKTVDNHFGIDHYITLFKTNGEKILNFDFSNYNQDPYLKTVFITWEITLEAIKNTKNIGEKALAILNIMSYLYPDNIANDLFLTLYSREEIAQAIHLLKSYSMISTGSQPDISIVHRLVQTVVRLNLEKNPVAVEQNAKNIIQLTQNYYLSRDIGLHYIYFLLHMVRYDKIAYRLGLGITRSHAIDVIILANYNIGVVYFYDAAHLILTEKEYCQFMGEALFLYIKHGLLFLLSETISYLEKQLKEGLMTRLMVLTIIDYRYRAANQYPYSAWLCIEDTYLLERQMISTHLLLKFQRKISASCDRKERQSRDVLCHISDKQSKPVLVQRHLQWVVQLSHVTSSKLLNEDNVLNLLKGKWDQVALNIEIMAENKFFTKISNLLLNSEAVTSTRKNLIANSSVNHSIILENFYKQQAHSDNDKSLLTYIKKLSKPFIKYSGSNLGNSYKFSKDLKTLQREKKLRAIEENNLSVPFNTLAGVAIPEMSNRQLNLDIEMLFSLIEDGIGLAEGFTETIAAATALKNAIERSFNSIKQVERYIHLSSEEKLIIAFRSFAHFDPPGYLKGKTTNNQLVKNALLFLNQMNSIQRYVFPAVDSSLQVAQDNQVFLQEKELIKVDSVMPDQLTDENASLFCLSGLLKNESYVKSSQWVYIEPYPPFMSPTLVNSYVCKGAIGVELTKNRTENTVLIALGDGKDEAIGVVDQFNIFLVNNGHKNFKGGEVGNLFIMQGENTTGKLEGGKGANSILLENFSRDETVVLLNNEGLLCEQAKLKNYNCVKGLQLVHIQRIYGRKELKEVIFVNRDIQYVDGFSGKSEDERDYIYLTRYLTSPLEIVLRPKTVIYAFQLNSFLNIPIPVINYKLNRQNGNLSLFIRSEEPIQHRFKIEFSLQALDRIIFLDNEMYFIFRNENSFFNLHISDWFGTIQLSVIRCFFESQHVLRLVNTNSLYIQEFGVYAIDSLKEFYSHLAQRLQMILHVFVVSLKKMLQVGYAGQPVILYSEPLLKNYLISQGDQTVYLIKPPRQGIDYPMHEIIIFALGNKNGLNMLDLREVCEQVRRSCSHLMITTEIIQQGYHLILRLKIDHEWLSPTYCSRSKSRWSILTIKLHDALIDNHYQHVEILLQSGSFRIAFDEQAVRWYLRTYPLVFSHEKSIIVLTQQDLSPEINILIFKEGNYKKNSFFCLNGTDLVLTNVFDSSTSVDEFCSIIFHQFYRLPEMREKVLTTQLMFIGQQMMPKAEAIDHAPCIDFNQVNSTQYLEKIMNKENATHEAHFFLENPSRQKRHLENKSKQTKAKNNLFHKSSFHHERDNNNRKQFNHYFHTTSGKQTSLAVESLPEGDFSQSHLRPSLKNNTDINSQSLFLTWIYHKLWGKKPKLVHFKPSVELENERLVYRAIDYYERLQNEPNSTMNTSRLFNFR